MVDFPKLLLPDLRQFKENVHTITSKLKSINNEIQKLAMATLCEDLEMIMFKKQHPETIKGQNQVQTFTPLSNKITKIFGGVNKIITDLIVSIVQSGNTPSNLSNYGSALSRLFITTVQTCKSIIENAQITKKEFDIIPIPNQQALNSLSNQFYQVSEILCKVYGSEIFDSYSTFSIPNSETLITIMNNFQEISNFWDIISENVINSNKNNTSFSSEILANLQQIQNKIIFIKENKAKIVETDNPNITILSELIGKLISLLTNIESSESDSKSKSKSPSNSFSTGTTHQFIIESANSLILQFSKITTEMKTKSINTKLVEDSNPIINQFNQILQLLTGNSQLFYSNTNYLTAFQSSLNQIYQIIKQLKPISESFETNTQESISSIFKLINLIQLLIFKQSHIIIRTSIQKFSENFISLFKSSNQAITGFGEEQKQKFSIFAQEAHLSLKNIANLTQLKDSKSLNNIDELVLKPLTLLLSKIIPFYNYVKELSVSVSDLDSQLNLLSSLSNFNNQFQNFKSLIETLIKLFSNKII
ncbi:hypothetical protein M0811_01496 [Anaeramoeba ignava]|uniref:Uncharacterized protein n=1 Tax=Anaeramoeba ignava TaxID=1746090 RepID=A0A9Q0LGX2_ANAIG|nr:hypothetical protein M0811_01496 [Anaeramoeba ignava]